MSHRFHYKNFAFAVLVFSAITFFKLTAYASSCCAGGSGQSVCILTSDQKYQIGIATSYKEILGHYDPYGNFKANEDGTGASVFTTTVGGAFRLNDDWQLALSVPFVRNEKSYSGVKSSAAGIGDPVVEGRYLVWEDLNFLRYRPQLIVYGGARLPMGKSIYQSKEPTEIDVTGEGITTFHLGLNAAKLFRPLNYAMDASYYYPVAKEISESHGEPVAAYSLKPGSRIQLVESATYLFSERLSSGLALKQQWQFESAINGSSVAGSASRFFSSILSVNYFKNATTSFSFSYETPTSFSAYLVNQPQTDAFSVAMIYGGL